MRRINRAKDKDPVIEALASGDRAIFSSFWSLFIFAAVLGFKNNRREKLSKFDSNLAIRDDLFTKGDLCFNGIINIIALMEVGQEKILLSNDENENSKVTIFEEYANGGLAILEEKLESSSYSLESVLAFIAEEKSSAGSKSDDLDITI
jgi:dnd system-associated protein 4